jgi:hypothetical protein
MVGTYLIKEEASGWTLHPSLGCTANILTTSIPFWQRREKRDSYSFFFSATKAEV